MAIIIPSRNIYGKSFNPVIDNNINELEVSVKNPTIINDTENVYNEKLGNLSNLSYESKEYDLKGRGREDSYIGITAHVKADISYVEMTPKYVNINVKIPKNFNNERITKLLTGIDDNGFANIKYSLRGIIKKGDETAQVSFRNIVPPVGSSTGIGSVIFNDDFSLNPPTNVLDEEGVYELYDKTKQSEYSNDEGFAVTAEVDITDLTNISSAFAEDKGNHFEISLVILCGLKIIKCKGSYSSSNYGTVYLNGSYEEYIPNQVDISFYGNTIRLDLQDETIKIGSGNKTFSFDGNELIQKNGTYAVIRIGGMLSSDSAVGLAEYECYVQSGEIEIGDVLYFNGEKATVTDFDSGFEYYVLDVVYGGEFASKSGGAQFAVGVNGDILKYQKVIEEWKNGKQTVVISCPIADYYDTDGNKVIDISTSGKMLFDAGDIVIPYTYTNKGDKPLSYNRDFAPKQFKVVGTKPSKRQGGMQELTLQEV